MRTQLVVMLLLASLSGFAADNVSARVKATWGAPDGFHTAWGTCFAVSATEIVTAYHTVDMGKIEVEMGDKFVEVVLSKYDEKLDIAVLTIKSHSLPVLPLKKDAPIAHASFKGESVSPHAGTVAEFVIRTKISIGASGAPVLIDDKVAGMIVSGTDIIDPGTGDCNAARCVGAGVISEFLSKK